MAKTKTGKSKAKRPTKSRSKNKVTRKTPKRAPKRIVPKSHNGAAGEPWHRQPKPKRKRQRKP